MKRKQNWGDSVKKEVNKKIDEKTIEQKLSNNLQKMKEVMNKKILNHDYIFTVLSNRANIEKNQDKLRK